jgi:TolB-like protein
MSGDPEQEYFADGIVEEIITALPHPLTVRDRLEIPASSTKAKPLTSSRSDANSASGMTSKVQSERQVKGFALRAN